MSEPDILSPFGLCEIKLQLWLKFEGTTPLTISDPYVGHGAQEPLNQVLCFFWRGVYVVKAFHSCDKCFKISC